MINKSERDLLAISDEEAVGWSLIDTTAHQVEEDAFVHLAGHVTQSGLADIHQHDLRKRGAIALDD